MLMLAKRLLNYARESLLHWTVQGFAAEPRTRSWTGARRIPPETLTFGLKLDKYPCVGSA